MEATVAKDCVNRQCESFADASSSLFVQAFWVRPKATDIMGHELLGSCEAVLAAGTIKTNDVVFLKTDPVVVGRVERFVEWNAEIFVVLNAYTRILSDVRRWSKAGARTRVLPASLVVDAVAWRIHSPNSIRIAPPFVV